MNLSEITVGIASLFTFAVCCTLLAEPLVIRWAGMRGIVDTPDWRRVHKGSIPRGGGAAFLPILVLGLGIGCWLWPPLWQARYTGLLAALFLISVVGFLDDVYQMRAIRKLPFQFVAGGILFFSGYRLGDMSIPFTNVIVELPYADFLITVVGVAAIINAVNMLDGLDGLAAGSVFIMCAFLFANKVGQGAVDATAVLVLVGGTALGFLRYNFHPAKVFMGDTGSMFLGLALAAETLDSASQGAAITTILLPLVILGIPILDMLRTMFTRFRVSRNVFAADKSHLHHRLLSLGLSHREAVVFIYGLNAYMGIMATLYKHIQPAYRGLFLLALGMFLAMASYLIGVGHRKGGNDPSES